MEPSETDEEVDVDEYNDSLEDSGRDSTLQQMVHNLERSTLT
jgi:hypothetical protein